VSREKLIHSLENLKDFLFLGNYGFWFGLVYEFVVIVYSEASDQHIKHCLVVPVPDLDIKTRALLVDKH
jgi:hypothetical protein